uniref:Putative TMV resistance protein N-like n=1 Tax=Davidia involucrata TaxID=16924 RepID=A0A5B7BGI1_DAVIN
MGITPIRPRPPHSATPLGVNSLSHPLHFMICMQQGQSEEYESNIYFPSKEIPDWFSHQGMGSSISFDMPLHVENKLLGMTLWVVYAAKEDTAERIFPPQALFSNITNGDEWIHMPNSHRIPVTREEHSWVSHIPQRFIRFQIQGGDKMEVSISINPPFKVKKCGIHLVYKQDITEDDQGQSSCVNTDDKDDLMDNMHPKRGRDVNVVDRSYDLANQEDFPKRLRIEPDRTKNSDMEP